MRPRVRARGVLVPAVAAALAWGATTARPARAQPDAVDASREAAGAARLVDEGRRHYRELSYLDAIDVLRRALATPGIDEAQRVEALEVLGASYVVLDRDDEAREAFEALFAIDPYHVVREPSGSPKIARFVDRVRADLVPDAALDPEVTLRAELPRAGRVGAETTVRVHASPPDRVYGVRLFVRGTEVAVWTDRALERAEPGVWRLRLPPSERADELELYAVGRDEADRVVARAGSPLRPLVLPIRLASEDPLHERWWLWAAIGGGAAVVAIVLTIALVATSGARAPPGTLPPGRVELP
ncbi:MAG TPA: hypothetical protein RMH99_09115 [Sandaracinaceae bacterium LLY-WYZ-13_1]|nr:hypothetical protein [Sandaracinaceae bacterium LLY-WYZ-13_1]